ncbi:MAG: ATP-binding protein [Desulfobacteraceae bacterium]|jgi:signal transduction histidine kinase
MTSNPERKKTEGKQFRLVKYFASASFIVLVLFSFPFSLGISQKAEEILLRSYENYALLVGQNLNHQVFQNFAVPVIRRFGRIQLRDEDQQTLMDQIVRNTVHGFNIDLVNIYDIGKGVIAYSTDPELIGKPVKKTPGYEKAVQGERSSRMLSENEELWGMNLSLMGGQKKLRTYIPFRGAHPFISTSYVAGVFEVIQDMTEPYESIVRFQFLVFGLSIGIMAAIFAALLLIVRKAEKIIEDRARERRKLEDQLHQAERLAALGEMVAGVSHEIKNPLGIIQSTAELMGGLPNTDENLRRLSGVIHEESSRLNGIVTEFLDFARPQTPNFRQTSLTDILQRNLTFLQTEIEKKAVRVTHNLDGRSFNLKADPDLLYRAFLNILINALQAQEDGGAIDIRVIEDRYDQRVEITDRGVGIPEESLKKLFNPFFTTKEQGTGLGLSIVRKIVEGHNGWITIHSEPKEKTTVVIRLPKEPESWTPS